jgi:type VI secretion system secreted protein Hcp
MAFDAYLKIDGIDGESTDKNHAKWIAILSYSHGLSQPVSSASGTGGRTSQRVDIQGFSIVKELDNASPLLALHCCNGKHIPKVQLELSEASENPHVYMKYTLEDAIVSSVRPGGSTQGGDNKPLEEVTFHFGKIKWEYKPIDSPGKPGQAQITGWDLTTNQKL